MNTELETLAGLVAGIALALMVLMFSAAVALQWLGRDDDEAAGVSLGQVSHAEDAFQHESHQPTPREHFIKVCCKCHTVTDAPGYPVFIGHELRVSHGYCRACSDAYEAEMKRLLPSTNSELSASAHA